MMMMIICWSVDCLVVTCDMQTCALMSLNNMSNVLPFIVCTMSSQLIPQQSGPVVSSYSYLLTFQCFIRVRRNSWNRGSHNFRDFGSLPRFL